MVDVLNYQPHLPPRRSPSRGTLARASMVAALATCAVEALALAAFAVVGRPAWLVLPAAVLLVAGWFIAVVFGVVAIMDHDGPRGLAVGALAIAAAEAGLLVLIPLVR